jgi:hypothetical protein
MLKGTPSWLHMALLDKAFSHFASVTPTVLATEADESPLSRADFGPWPIVRVPATAELPSRAGQLLHAGPVLLVPPWERIEGPRRGWRAEYEAVLSECEPPRPGVLLAALLPAGALTSASSVKFRRALARHWQPTLVLYAREIVPGIHPLAVIATVFLRSHEDAARLPLRMFEYTPGDDNATVLGDLSGLLKRKGGRGELGYVLRDTPEPEAGLAFARHDPVIRARLDALSHFGGAVKLEDVFEQVFYGFNMVADRQLVCDANDLGAVRVVSGRDLKRDGTIGPPDEWTKWAMVPPDRQLKVGDVLAQGIANPTDRRGLAAVGITDADLPLVANQSVVVMRFGPTVESAQQSLILQYLRSLLAREILISLDSGARVSIGALRELPLPQPDEALSVALGDLAKAVRRFDEWRAEAEGVLLSAFPRDEDFKAGRARLVTYGRISRLRVESATNLDDDGYIFRTRFPYPVAYRWRVVEAEKSAGVSRDAYDAVLQAAEVLLCYAAHLALVLARGVGAEIGYRSNIRTTFGRGRGPGFGDWASIVEEVRDGREFRNLPEAHPLRDLQSLLKGPAARDARRRLNDRRNNEAHLRNVDATDLPEAFESAHADLITLLKAADFLSDLPLIHVTDVRWDSIRRRNEVAYRELMGDHPVTPTRALSYDDPGVEKDSLYLVDHRHRLHLLRPFLIGRMCPTCQNWSTFHVDGVKQETVSLKSLEHGHTTTDATLTEPLRHVGLV